VYFFTRGGLYPFGRCNVLHTKPAFRESDGLEANSFADLVMFFPVVRGLPPELHEIIRSNGRRFQCQVGERLYEPDTVSFGLLMVTRGAARAIRRIPDGRLLTLFRVRPGECCSLTAISTLAGTGIPASAVAEVQTTGVRLSRQAYLRLIRESESMREFVFEQMAGQIRTTLEAMEAIAFRRLDQRLAGLLLEKPVPVRATHQQLADELLSAREMVSRLLKSFERRGLVRLGRGRIEVLNRQTLQQISADGDGCH
jgi:CRP/FNR family transcriptional regulator